MSEKFVLKLYVTKAAHAYAAKTSPSSRQIAIQCERGTFDHINRANGRKLILASCFELHLADTRAVWAKHQITDVEQKSFDGLYSLLSNLPGKRAELTALLL